MMVNTVPSFYVSLELMLSESNWDSDDHSDTDTVDKSVQSKTPEWMRWYALFMYCSTSFMQAVLWYSWSPIASSALYAFPSWEASTVALLNSWGYLTYILFILPTCWMLNRKGLRTSYIVATFLCLLGAAIRFLGMKQDHFTLVIHVGAILNAIGGVIIGPSIVLLSSTWFPSYQRTYATGIGTSASLLGMAGSYLLGPTMVSEPPLPGKQLRVEAQQIKIRTEISHFLLISFIAEAIMFGMVFAFFPAKPPLPPSRSSVIIMMEKQNFCSAMKNLISNRDIWLLSISSALCFGISGPWFSFLTLTFSQSGISQCETAKIGFWTIICGCCLGLSVSKVSDYCQGNLRLILALFLATTVLMFLIVVLIRHGVLPFSKAVLVAAIMAGTATVWSTTPLYYELGAELAYPVSEGILAGYMMCLTNITVCVVYILIYTSPSLDVTWMNYGLIVFALGSFIALCFVREAYHRLSVDLSE